MSIFEEIKEVFRRAQEHGWEDIDMKEASRALVTESEVYHDTGTFLGTQSSYMTSSKYVREALEDAGLSPKKLVLDISPLAQKDGETVLDIISIVLEDCGYSAPKDRIYADVVLMEGEKDVAEGKTTIVATSPDRFDEEKISRKLDFYENALGTRGIFTLKKRGEEHSLP